MKFYNYSSLLLSLLLLSLAYSQDCTDYTSQDAAAFINTNLPGGDGAQEQVTISKLVINCLSTSGQPNRYLTVTFTANFTRLNGEILMGQGDTRCIAGNLWDTAGGDYNSLTQSEFDERINTTLPRMDCFRCIRIVADDPITHCDCKLCIVVRIHE